MTNLSDRHSFTEQSGLLFESLGMTRMSGRILGYLMVTDKEMVSFEELTQVLQASKSSISTSVKACINTGFAEAVTLPGDRKTYYRLPPDIAWAEMFKGRLVQLMQMNELFIKAIHLRANPKDKTTQWLTHAHAFYEWVIEETPRMLEKWNTKEKSS
jgi:DNA-binding transcriptional regulator GbsR (MarR family)